MLSAAGQWVKLRVELEERRVNEDCLLVSRASMALQVSRECLLELAAETEGEGGRSLVDLVNCWEWGTEKKGRRPQVGMRLGGWN